jgi:hypothetical protein
MFLNCSTCLGGGDTAHHQELKNCSSYTTFTNSSSSPHSVFMCFVWLWEQTAIISLYNINWLVCITETECVYCAVRTGYLNMIPVNFSLFRQCRGLSSRRPRFDPTADYWDLWWINRYWKMFIFRVLQLYLVGIILPVLSSHYHVHFALTIRTNKWSLRTCYKSMLFRKPGSAGHNKLVLLLQPWLHFRHILTGVGWQRYNYKPSIPFLSHFGLPGSYI